MLAWNPGVFWFNLVAFFDNLISNTAKSLLMLTFSKPSSLGKYSSTTVTDFIEFSWFKPTILCFKISATWTATGTAWPVAFKITTSRFFSMSNRAVYEIFEDTSGATDSDFVLCWLVLVFFLVNSLVFI